MNCPFCGSEMKSGILKKFSDKEMLVSKCLCKESKQYYWGEDGKIYLEKNASVSKYISDRSILFGLGTVS